MSSIVQTASSNPLIVGLLVLLVGALIYAAVKRLLKLAVVFLLGLGAVSAYFAYTGREAPEALERVQQGVRRTVKKGAEKGAEKAKALGERLERAAKEEAGEALEAAGDEVKAAAEDGAEAAEDALSP